MAMTGILFCMLFESLAGASLEDGLRLMKEERYDQAVPVLEEENHAHPGSTDVLINLGWAYWHAKRPEDAFKCWSMLVTLQPNNPTFLRLLATLETERRNFREAAELSRKALKFAPEDKDAAIVLAKALVGLGRHQEAMEIMEGLMRARPESASARLGLADLLAQLDRPQDSLAYLDGLIKTDPANPSYRKRRAEVLYGLGRVDEAVGEWKSLAEQRPPDPEAMLRLGWAYLRLRRIEDAAGLAYLLLELDPGNAGFLRLSANVEFEKKNFERAEALARRAAKASPADTESSLILAKALIGLQRQKEGAAILETLLLAHPDSPALRYEMADVLALTGRAQDSLATLDDLLRADPDNAAYHKRRAQILNDLDRVDEAAAEFKALSERKPPDLDALLKLGWIYAKQKKNDEAEKAANVLVRLDPGNPSYVRFMASVQLAKEDYPEAIKWARLALKLAPGDMDNSVELARALINARKEEEGIEIISNLIRNHRENTSVWFQMASVLFHMGKSEEAVPYYDKLLQADPGNVNWRRQRAEALYQSGRFREALSEWKDLGRQNPPDVRSLRRLADDAFFRRAYGEFFDRVKELGAVEPLTLVSWTRIENAYAALNDIPRALATAEKIIELNHVALDGYFMKAELLAEKPDLPAAQKVYEYCLTRNPHSRRALDGLARVTAERFLYKEAIRILDQIENGYPSVKAYPYLGLRKAAYVAEAGQPEEALKLVQVFTETRPTVIPALLYHGISQTERSESPSVAAFRAQMRALKKAGYHSITVSQLVPFVKEGKPLPKKPILITFDDGRADAFRNADPVLAEMGFKATMMVIGAGLTRYPYHASAESIRRYRATGRWEIQSHSDRSHEPLPVDAEGHVEPVLANRKWLPEEGRNETVEEYKARVEADYISGKKLLEETFPGSPVVGFAFPMGEYGQIDANNAPEAAAFNRAMVLKHFNFSFIQDIHGFNSRDSLRSEWTRFEVYKETTPDMLMTHLQMDEPWVQAKMLEARLWVWIGQPARSLEIIKELDREGIRGPEFYAQKGIVLERLGQAYEARKLYALASAIDPAAARYQQLASDAAVNYGPTLGSEFGSFSDDASRSNSRAMMRLGAPVREVELSGLFGQESYSEKGAPHLSGMAGGLNVRWVPLPVLDAQVSYTHHQLAGTSAQIFDAYRAGASWLIRPEWKWTLDGEKANLESALAIVAGINHRRLGTRVEWDPTLNDSFALSLDRAGYSDGNSEKDLRLELTRRLTEWLAMGYSFWYGDSAAVSAAYWTPHQLRQHMGFLTFSHALGPVKGRLQVGEGYGFQGISSHSVNSLVAGLDWKIVDYLFFSGAAVYNRSPFYVSRQLNGGISLKY